MSAKNSAHKPEIACFVEHKFQRVKKHSTDADIKPQCNAMQHAKKWVFFLNVSTVCLITLLACRGGGAEFPDAGTGTEIPPTESAAAVCPPAGGLWRQFPNSCADQCAYVRNPASIMCAQALTYNCDCGPDRCFTGRSCEPN